MNRNKDYLNLFREVEQKAVLLYEYPDDGKAITYLISEKEFKDLRVSLKACKEVRNLLSHYPGDIIEPSPILFNTLNECINRLDSSKTLADVMTPFEKLVTAHLNDLVVPKLRELKRRGLSNMPIIEGKNPVGIYSGLCFSSLIPDREEIDLEVFRFKDFGEYIRINKMNPTKVGVVSKNMKLWDARRLLRDRVLTKPINVLLITEDGTYNTPLLGLVTYADLTSL